MNKFKGNLKYGLAGESLISKWLQGRGYGVMPAYEKILNTGKGPQIFHADGRLVAPDMLVFNTERSFWVEAKHKDAFSWYRKKSRWVTGIDLHHYEDYCKVADLSQWEVHLMFLHEGGHAKDSPEISPSGLYWGELGHLRANESHWSTRWGRHGMVYWAEDTLKKIAELSEVEVQD